MADRPTPSEQELEVLKVLWDEGPSTVRGVDEVLRSRGVRRIYTHWQTLLNRLQAKGHVASEARPAPLGHLYRAVSTRDDLLRDRLQDLANELCEGATVPLVLTLVEGRAFSDADLARLRAVLDTHRPRLQG